MQKRAQWLLLSLLLLSCKPARVFSGVAPKETLAQEEVVKPIYSTGNFDVPVAIPERISPDAPGCGRGKTIPTTREPVHLMFVFDRSLSFVDSPPPGQPTKWVALQTAVKAVLQDMRADAAAGDTTLAVGIDFFPDNDTLNAADTKDTVVEFPMQLLDTARADTLITYIDNKAAGGRTPSLAALQLSYPVLENFNPPSGSLTGGKKVLVFLSDGKPAPDPPANAIQDLVQQMRMAGIQTYSIGIGDIGSQGATGYEPKLMSQIADRGGTGKPGCDPNEEIDVAKFCHFQISPSSSANITQGVDAFHEIREATRSCEVSLAIEDPDSLEPRAVIVVAETNETDPQRLLPKNPDTGWTFDNDTAPTKIRLNGAECTSLRESPTSRVFAIIGCACDQNNPSGGGAGGGGGTGGREVPTRGVEGETPPEGTGGGAWNTDWCSYPYVPGSPGDPAGGGGQGG